MNRISHSVFLIRLFFAVSVLALSACATTAPDTPEADTAEPAEVVIEPWDGHGLDIPLDGGSMEAWETSLARIKAHTSGEEYDALQRAIQWHLAYDIGARQDMDLLISRLDGKTGNEIISSVRWINRFRSKDDSGANPDAGDSR